MKTYNVIVEPEAKKQMGRHLSYIKNKLKNPQAADSVYRDFLASVLGFLLPFLLLFIPYTDVTGKLVHAKCFWQFSRVLYRYVVDNPCYHFR